MAKNQTIDVHADVLKADAIALGALKGIAKYDPSDATCTLEKLEALQTALLAADDTVAQTKGSWKAARDAQVAAQWAFHNGILAAKRNVLAQFGDDSDEAQSIGLKKASDRKSPRHTTTASTATPPAAAQ